MPAFETQRMSAISALLHSLKIGGLGLMLGDVHVMQELGDGITLPLLPLLVTPGPGVPICRSALDKLNGSLLHSTGVQHVRLSYELHSQMPYSKRGVGSIFKFNFESAVECCQTGLLG